MSLRTIFRNLKQSKAKLAAIGLATAAIGLGVGLSSAANTAQLTLSPASGSHDINTTFSVTVYENSSDPVNAVQADFSYDGSKLQFVSIDASTSAFDSQYPSSGGNGKVKIARANTAGSLTGNQVVAKVNFKVLAGSGSTTMSFLTSSEIIRTSDTENIWDRTTTGGTYTLTTPPATCPAGQTGTPPNCTTPQTTTTTTTTNSTSAPKINTSTNSNPSSPPSNAANQQADPAAPVSVSTTTAANAGYFVAIKVISPEGKPVKDADVTLNKKTVKSDSTGIASFVNVPAGSYTAKIHSVLGDSTINVTVDANTPPGQVQEFATQVRPRKSILPYVVVPVILLLAGAAFWFIRKRTGRFPWTFGNNNAIGAPSAVVTDTNNSVVKPLTIEAIEKQLHSPHAKDPKDSDLPPSAK